MKTTYKYQVFAFIDGGLRFYAQETCLSAARAAAFDVDRFYPLTFVVRIPDRSPVSLNYAPRCWRVTGCAFKELELCSLVDVLEWI